MSLHKMLRAAAGYQAPAPANTDPQFNYVSMLLHGDGTNGSQNNTFVDSSTNNFTITRNGNTTQGSLSPYGSLWSNYFDGSGDYLTVPAGSAFAYGTGDFTVEGWFYVPTDVPLYGMNLFSQTTSGTNYFMCTLDSPQKVYFTFATSGGGTAVSSGSSTYSKNTWNHFAVVRNSGSVTVYLNGVGGTPVSCTQDFNNTTYVPTIGTYSHTQTNLFTGYLSNFRVVKGTAVYTGNFTPPTAPLTAISGTSLLTCQSNRIIDNSANNFTITRNGDVRVTKESPFLPTAAYSTSTIGGSGYFDGNGGYLTGSHPSMSGTWTVECWWYATTVSVQQTIVSFNSGSNAGINIWCNPSAQLVVDDGANPQSAFTGGTFTPNAWNHVAVVRNGTTTTGYINGVAVGSNAFTPGSVSAVSVGRYNGATFFYVYGYISNLRVVAGTAVYTAAFTPPTAPVTAITNTSLLLNFTNAGIFDNAAENVLETVGNAQISTSVKKYGTGSLAFDGNGDWLAPNDALPYTFGSGDFTVEFWLYLNSTQTAMLYDGRPVSGVGATPTIYVASNVLYYFTNNANRITGSTLSNTTWTHVALCKSGGNTRLFVNGTQVGSTYADSVTYTNTAGRPLIGASGETVGQFPLNGYIDDLRITKGYARYTANFTPPTAAFPDQ